MDDRELLIRAANMAADHEIRQEAADHYRQMFGEDVPRIEGPALEGQTIGPPGRESLPTPPPPIPGSKAMNRLELLGDRMSNMATMGLSRPIMDALGLGSGPARRAQLEADPDASGKTEIFGTEVPLTGVIGDTLGGLSSSVAGPARFLDQGIRAGAKSIGGALAPALRTLGRGARSVLSTVGNVATGAASGVAGNAAQNVGERGFIPKNMNEAMRLYDIAREGAGSAAMIGAGGDLMGALANRGSRVLRGPPGRETKIGEYRNIVDRHGTQHPELPDSTPGYSGGMPSPEDVAHVNPEHLMAMRDSFDAANLAATKANTHRANKAATTRDTLEAKAAPYQGLRVNRQAIIDDLQGEMTGNVTREMGVTDDSLHATQARILGKLEGTRPEPRPVLEGARVPREQLGLRLPGTPPLARPTPPLEVPSHAPNQERLMLAPPPPPPIPGLPETGVAVGPYQRELPLPEPELKWLSHEDAIGDPTIGNLRKLRKQARERSGFSSRNPATPPERDARSEYFIYDRGIKRTAPAEYLGIEGEMADSARGYRREGDLLNRTEGAIQAGESGVPRQTHESSADDLGDIVAEDRINAAEDAAPADKQGIRVTKQQGAARLLRRVGDQNDAGKTARPALEELAGIDPTYEDIIRFVKEAKVLEAVRPGLRALVPLNSAQAFQAPRGSAILMQNLRALGGRLVVPSLEAAGRNLPKASRITPLLRDPMDGLLNLMRDKETPENAR